MFRKFVLLFSKIKTCSHFFWFCFNKKKSDGTIKKIIELSEKLNFRIPTSQLNRYIEGLIQQFPHNQRFRVYYATQVSERPPIIVLFCNNKQLVKNNFINYLENKIKSDFNLEGIPIRIKLKDKDEDRHQ
ncbi:MAG: hypothetical protein ACK42K_06340 [Leptonema sp. (in: bacteria)]